MNAAVLGDLLDFIHEMRPFRNVDASGSAISQALASSVFLQFFSVRSAGCMTSINPGNVRSHLLQPCITQIRL